MYVCVYIYIPIFRFCNRHSTYITIYKYIFIDEENGTIMLVIVEGPRGCNWDAYSLL